MARQPGIETIEGRIERLRRLIGAAHLFCNLVEMSKEMPGGVPFDPRLDDSYERFRSALADASEAVNGTRDDD